jgi:hypothetical protein
MNLQQVPWFLVPTIWPHVKEWVVAGLNRGVGYTPEDIYRALLARDMALWVVRNTDGLLGCAVTSLWSQPRVRVCDVLLTGGKRHTLRHWHHLIQTIEAYASEQGCDEVRAHGRRGWKKEADRHGYGELCTVYRKKLR